MDSLERSNSLQIHERVPERAMQRRSVKIGSTSEREPAAERHEPKGLFKAVGGLVFGG
jgi:hypothetical protein